MATPDHPRARATDGARPRPQASQTPRAADRHPTPAILGYLGWDEGPELHPPEICLAPAQPAVSGPPPAVPPRSARPRVAALIALGLAGLLGVGGLALVLVLVSTSPSEPELRSEPGAEPASVAVLPADPEPEPQLEPAPEVEARPPARRIDAPSSPPSPAPAPAAEAPTDARPVAPQPDEAATDAPERQGLFKFLKRKEKRD